MKTILKAQYLVEYRQNQSHKTASVNEFQMVSDSRKLRSVIGFRTGQISADKPRFSSGAVTVVKMRMVQKASEAITGLARVPEPVRERIFGCQTEDDWDDEGAVGVTMQACESAVGFLQTLLKHNRSLVMPKPSPSVYGSVTLYWRKGERHLIVRPSPNLDLAYYQLEEPDSRSIYGDESKDQGATRIVNFLSGFDAEQN